MKRNLALLLTLALALTLLGACGGDDSAVSPSASPSGEASPSASGTPSNTDAQPTQAVSATTGNTVTTQFATYETDEWGIPLESYEYELPLTSSTKAFTYTYSSIIVGEIPDEGVAAMQFQTMLREKTGVVLEYNDIPFMSRMDRFALDLASDNLDDLISGFTIYFPAPLQNALDENFTVNLYDYREYFPNYWMNVNAHSDDINVLAQAMPYRETMYAFLGMEAEYVTRNSLGARGDWLDKIGKTNMDIVTMQDLHDMLVDFKVQCGADSPFLLMNTIDPHQSFSAFDTNGAFVGLPGRIVVDGKVQLAMQSENDKKLMTMLNQWYEEGLVPQDWQSIGATADSMPGLFAGVHGVTGMIAGEGDGFGINATDPNAYWVPLHKPVLTRGQTFHLGDVRTWIGIGSWGISSKCSNIPLLMTYCDWFYSPAGMFDWNYGVEGYTFTFNENGEPQLTDFLINHPSGTSWALLQYCMDDVLEGGITMRMRTYAYPGGEKFKAWHAFWDNPEYYKYDGSMQYPTAITLTRDQNSRIATLSADISTFIAENYLSFIDGSKPFSEWNAYMASVKALGWDECELIYQNAYDDFMERFA